MTAGLVVDGCCLGSTALLVCVLGRRGGERFRGEALTAVSAQR
jgi:hypothetical protein